MVDTRAVVAAVLAGAAFGLAPAVPVAGAQEPPIAAGRVFRNKVEEIRIPCRNCVLDEAKGRSADKPQPRPQVAFDEGTTCPVCTGSGYLKAAIDWTAGFYKTEGIGVPSRDAELQYRRADAAERPKVLAQARVDSKRAATLDAWRNAVLLAARVRLDGEKRVGTQAQKLQAELVGMEEEGDGEWITTHARPFFRQQVRVPLWGVKGVIASLLEESREAAKSGRAKQHPIDWRTAGGAKPPGEKPPGEQPPGEKPPGEKPPGEKPPGDGAEKPPGEKPPGETPAPAAVEAAKPADEVTGIIIDAREVAKDDGPVNAALFPQIVILEDEAALPEEPAQPPTPPTPPGTTTPPTSPGEPAKPPAPAPGEVLPEAATQTVHDVTDADPQAVASKGMITYVESDTPFDRISAIFSRKGWIVVRVAGESESLAAGPGFLLQVQVGDGGGKKKKVTFKVKAADVAGAERANIVISAQDARALKATDAATGALKNCKVIVISGGDVAGRRGALPDGVETAAAK